MKDQVLLITLTAAFKSINNFKTDTEKHRGFKLILEKANSLLNMRIARLNNKDSLTPKVLKKEKSSIKLNKKIEKEVIKEKETLFKNEEIKVLAEYYLIKVKEYFSLVE